MQPSTFAELACASFTIYLVWSIFQELICIFNCPQTVGPGSLGSGSTRPLKFAVAGGGHRLTMMFEEVSGYCNAPDIARDTLVRFHHLVKDPSNLPAQSSKIAWGIVPLPVITPILTRNQLGDVARAHGVKSSSSTKKLRLLELVAKHDCNMSKCAPVYSVFAVVGATEQPHAIERHEEHLRTLFPPEPLTRRERAAVVRGWMTDADPLNLKEAGCAVCAQLTPVHKMSPLDQISVDLSLIERVDSTRAERQLPTDAIRSVPGPLLVPGCDQVCIQCVQALKKREVPRLSLANGLWIGEVPDVLKDLSFAEQMMIAKVRHNKCVVRVASGRGKLSANAIMFQNPTLKVYNRLPPTRDEMAEVLSIIFVGVARPDIEDYRRTPMLVRRDKVRRALEWLKLNHSSYEELDIAWDTLNSYPLEGVPVYVEHHLPNNTNTEKNPLEKSVFDRDDDNEDNWGTEDGLCTFRVHGLTGETFEKLSTEQLKMRALNHLRSGGDSLAIGHAAMPESMWDNPSLYPSMFPWLFPYGYGGLGNILLRINRFSEKQHKQWLLMYHDKRFQTDLYFPLVAFNHAQIKSSKSASRFVTENDTFSSVSERLFSINTSTLETLAKRMSSGEHLNAFNVETDDEKACFRLLDDLDIIGGHVQGSLTQKKYMRNEIWSLVAHLGAPSWFVTFSPVDQKHPLCLYYAGKEIEFPLGVLSSDERNRRIAQNPVAAARFFNIMVKLFIKHILGVGAGHRGVYGETAGYYGTVEQQGRLTLHLHALIWIKDAPSPKEVREKLLNEEGVTFQSDLIKYLESCFQGEFLTGSLEAVRARVNPRRAAERRRGLHDLMLDDVDNEDGPLRDDYVNPELTLPEIPPQFCEGHYLDECEDCSKFSEWERQYAETVDDLLLRSNQHTHTAGGSVERVKSKKDQKIKPGKGCLNDAGVCTARFPRDIVAKTYVDETDGAVIMKHLVPMMNTITPLLTYLLRCNTDVSSLMSGTAIQAVVVYVSNYITKPALKTHHIFQAIVDLFRDRLTSMAGSSEKEQEAAKSILMQIVNALSSKLEIGSPMASLYLLDHPDYYTDHDFKLFWWKNYVTFVRRRWGIVDEHASEKVVINTDGKKLVSFRNTDDYVFRPEKYNDVCLYEWIRRTHKRSVPESKRGPPMEVPTGYMPFLNGHGQAHSHVVSYSERDCDKVALNFVGGSLPRQDSGDREYYCCTMLSMFVPWRTGRELKSDDETWDDAFTTVSPRLKEWQKKKIANFNLQYECRDARDDYHAALKRKTRHAGAEDNGQSDDEDGEENGMYTADYAEEELFASETAEMGRKEARRLKAMAEMERVIKGTGWTGRQSDPFEYDSKVAKVPSMTPGKWKKLVADTRAQVLRRGQGINSEKDDKKPKERFMNPRDVNRVEPVDTRKLLTPRWAEEQQKTKQNIETIFKSLPLNKKQREAFDFVMKHVATPGKDPLKFYLAGRAGTGKTQVLKALQAFFEQRGESHRLMALAPTGTAAAGLGGSTYHWAFGIHGSDTPVIGSEATNVRKMRSNLAGVDYIFIDEVSMISCRDMYNISAKLAKALQEPDKPFGGMNVIFAGDFAQLPPVHNKALYHKVDENISPRMKAEKQEEYIGKAVWHQVTDVIVLTEVMRQTENSDENKAFQTCLSNMRYGECTEEDISFLRRRTVGPAPERPKLTDPDFRNVAIITPFNAQKDKMNQLGVERFARDSGQDLVHFRSIDNLPATPSDKKKRKEKKTPPRIPPKTKEYLWSAPPNTSDHFAGTLSLCIGMPVMIRHNDAVELCITKGQDGVVCGWDSHVDEDGHQILDVLFVRLTNPPRNVTIPGLERNVVPIMRTSRRIWCFLPNDNCIRVVREQVDVLPFFAMTVHASQGKTREKNPIDMNYGVSHQSFYTALSRGKTAEGTVLVQGFSHKNITEGMSGYLRQELREMDLLAEITALRHRGKLPPCVRGSYRRALLNSYKAWRATQIGNQANTVQDEANDGEFASQVNGEWRMIDKDKVQYENLLRSEQALAGNSCSTKSTDLPSVSESSQSTLIASGSSATVVDTSPGSSLGAAVTSRKRPMADVNDNRIKRIKSMPASATPYGLKWDGDNYSCAYDALITCLWRLWLQEPQVATRYIRNDCAYNFLRAFPQVLRGESTLEQIRDDARAALHQWDGASFPWGKTLTAIDAVRSVMFAGMFNGSRYRSCITCGWQERLPEPDIFSAMTITRSPAGTIEEWFRLHGERSLQASCPSCLMFGQPSPLQLVSVVENALYILALNIADPDLDIQYRWSLSTARGSSTIASECGSTMEYLPGAVQYLRATLLVISVAARSITERPWWCYTCRIPIDQISGFSPTFAMASNAEQTVLYHVGSTIKAVPDIPREMYDQIVENVPEGDLKTTLACMGSFRKLRLAILSAKYKVVHVKTAEKAVSTLKIFDLPSNVDRQISIATHVRDVVVGQLNHGSRRQLDPGVFELLAVFPNVVGVTISTCILHTRPVTNLSLVTRLTLRDVVFEQMALSDWLLFFPSLRSMRLYGVVARNGPNGSSHIVPLPCGLNSLTLSAGPHNDMPGEQPLVLYGGIIPSLASWRPVGGLTSFCAYGVGNDHARDIACVALNMSHTLQMLNVSVATGHREADSVLGVPEVLRASKRVLFTNSYEVGRFSYS